MRFKRNIITISGKKVFYLENNNAQKEVIVLLHGFPGTHTGLLDLANYLGNEYRVILPDLPACGQSEPLKKESNLKNYSDWLNDFLKHISVRKAIIIGHSFGARLALTFNVNYPDQVAQLVLITPMVEVSGLITRLSSLYYIIAEMLPTRLQKELISNKYYKEAIDVILFKSMGIKKRHMLTKRGIRELKNVNVRVHAELFNEFYKFSLIPIGKKIKTKSLIIAGDLDEIAPLNSVRKFASQSHAFELKVVKRAGHFVPLEKPLAIAKIIKSWLAHYS